MAIDIILAPQPSDGKKTSCENSDFIENQKPADRMLSELTQGTLSWNHQL